jgi:hypothetical protein
MAEGKKAWVTPEVIVLVRIKPEEAVLEGCKTALGMGNQSLNGDCSMVPVCTLCTVDTSS